MAVISFFCWKMGKL